MDELEKFAENLVQTMACDGSSEQMTAALMNEKDLGEIENLLHEAIIKACLQIHIQHMDHIKQLMDETNEADRNSGLAWRLLSRYKRKVRNLNVEIERLSNLLSKQ